MKRKILSTMLCLLLVASTMLTVACANEQTSSTTGNNNNVTNPSGDPDNPSSLDNEIDPALLELNFAEDGEPTKVTFVFAESAEDTFTARSIEADSSTGNPVDAAVEVRNAAISAALGVEIDSWKATDSFGDLQGVIGTYMAGQDPEIDVIAGYQYFDINCATQGWVMNYANMVDDDGTKIDYVNYNTKSYWGNAYIDALTYKDIVYWVTGDLSLRFVGGVYCTYVNKRLYEQYLEPTYGSIYDIVDRGEWTMEMLYTMANIIYEDDGDQVVGQEDVIGFAWEDMDPIDGIAFSCQVPFSTKSANNDSVTITLNSNRSVTFVGELEKLLYADHSVKLPGADSGNVMPLFNSGTVGFVVNKLFQSERYLTKMVDDYMIVPSPKLNTDQKEYTTGIHDGCTIYGISYFSDAKAAAAATLEYMAYLSHRDLRPIYYDQMLKNKYTNDESSARMIDIIHDGVDTDFVAAWSHSIQDIVHWFRSHNKTTGFTRDLKRYEPAQNSALEKLLADLESYADE